MHVRIGRQVSRCCIVETLTFLFTLSTVDRERDDIIGTKIATC